MQANKAIVGRNAFAHEAGIHQDGVLKDPRTYEIMRPQDVGQPAARLVLGRHSGRHAVQQRCDAIGLRVSQAEIEHVYHEVITLGERRKAIGDGDLRRIVDHLRAGGGSRPRPRRGQAEQIDRTVEAALEFIECSHDPASGRHPVPDHPLHHRHDHRAQRRRVAVRARPASRRPASSSSPSTASCRPISAR